MHYVDLCNVNQYMHASQSKCAVTPFILYYEELVYKKRQQHVPDFLLSYPVKDLIITFI